MFTAEFCFVWLLPGWKSKVTNFDKMSSQMSAIELLHLGDEDRKKPALTDVFPTICGIIFGVSTGMYINYGTRRPLLSGIQKHALGVAIFVPLFMFLDRKRRDYFAEQDAILRHYVQLHPEDFPTPEKKKLADVLEDWYPIR